MTTRMESTDNPNAARFEALAGMFGATDRKARRRLGPVGSSVQVATARASSTAQPARRKASVIRVSRRVLPHLRFMQEPRRFWHLAKWRRGAELKGPPEGPQCALWHGRHDLGSVQGGL